MKLFLLPFVLILLANVNIKSQGVILNQGPLLTTARIAPLGIKVDDGRVVVFGGHGLGFVLLNSAEIWNPNTNSFTSVQMNDNRDYSGITKLSNGKYLLFGGCSSNLGVGHLATMEIFNPATSTFTSVTDMNYVRCSARGTELKNGKVLIAGSWYNDNSASYGEVYDPVSNTCTTTGILNTPRANPFIIPTNDGNAILLGGNGVYSGIMIEQLEFYNTSSNAFTVLKNTLFDNEPGWAPLISTYDIPNTIKLSTGKYVFLGYKSENGVINYCIFTVDPENKSIEKLDINPVLPKYDPSNGDSLYFSNLVYNQAKNCLYLLAIIPGNPNKYSVATVNLNTNSFFLPTVFFDCNYYLHSSPKFILGNDSLFVIGGNLTDNFDAVNNTLFIKIDGVTNMNDQKEIVEDFELYQNYPNPFNPTTTIKYSLPEACKVTLVIYDILGNIVSTLVDSYQEPGTYNVDYTTQKISSSIYLYQLKAGEFSKSRKMIVIK